MPEQPTASVEPVCPKCKGKKEIDCPHPACVDGLWECPTCGTDRACLVCKGEGFMPCPDCKPKETTP
jgi:hypothetical protein